MKKNYNFRHFLILPVGMILLPGLVARPDTWRAPNAPENPRTAWGQEVPSTHSGTIPLNLYSQVLDAPAKPEYSLSLAILGETEFGSYGETDMAELDFYWKLAFYRNVLLGDVDFAVLSRNLILRDSMELILPDMLSSLALEAGWLWRYTNGYAFELRTFPGLYGDIISMSSDLFGAPTRILLHRAIHTRLAGVAGIEIRPGWDLPLIPIGGFAWEAPHLLRCELMVPRSRALLYLGRITLFATAEWRNISYAVDEGRLAPSEVTFNDYLLSGGALLRITDEINISLEAGTFIDRELSSDVVNDPNISLDGGDFIRVGWSGPF